MRSALTTILMCVAGGAAVARCLDAVAADPSEAAAPLSGDILVPDANVVADRACDLAVAPEALWPWIAQLGKGRGGWYFPAWLEAVTPRRRRALRHADPRLADPQVGSEHADWGPGDPVLRVTEVEAGHGLVYHSLRARDQNYGWPAATGDTDTQVFAMSWQLVLTPIDSGTRLHLRLRARSRTRLFGFLGDVFDGLTVALLFAGLRERVETAQRGAGSAVPRC